MNFAHALAPGKGYGSPASLQSLKELKSLHVDSVAVTPFGFQRRATDTNIVWVGDSGRWISESNDSLRGVIAQAHQLGMKVMLKPHLWLRPPEWPGVIDPGSDTGWREWFSSYETFIVHYAALAEETHAEMLCIGNELTKSARHEREWRALIGKIRTVYRGPLVYGANTEEVFDVPFWDAVDAIGVSAYFSLASGRSPDIEAIARGWRPIVEKFAALAARWKKPVIFTELGYGSHDFAAERPWEDKGEVNPQIQAEALEAFFHAVWPQPWLGGVYLWKWKSYPDHAGHGDAGFEIEHKPAEAVVRKHFGAP